jgi:Na+/H+ antiporter NhaD/arsenite permease-like protein
VILVSIAIGINIGSVMTPIGSPQNLLIASQSGVSMPFITFLSILGPPAIINLFLSGLVLHFYYKKNMYILSLSQEQELNYFNDSVNYNNNRIDEESKIKSGLIRFSFSNKFAKISVIVFLSTLGAIVLSEIFNLLFNVVYLDIGTISLLGAASLYIFCKERISILKSVNYSVLIFFIGMFIFTSALWTSGLISDILQLFPPVSSDNTYNNLIYDNAIISAVSIILSQILSNVPFVATYNLYMIQNGFDKDDVYSWLMLAAASTVAGNLTIFGAASNIIIMQTAESRGVRVFTFLEFLKIGSAITGLNIVVLYLFLIFHSSYNL